MMEFDKGVEGAVLLFGDVVIRLVPGVAAFELHWKGDVREGQPCQLVGNDGEIWHGWNIGCAGKNHKLCVNDDVRAVLTKNRVSVMLLEDDA